MSLSKAEERALSRIEKKLDKSLKKQAQDALYIIFKEAGCGAIAKDIKAGRNVTGNAAFGIRMCIHNKVAPRYNPTTKKFFPMTKRGKELEEGFIKTTNLMLENAGFKKMPSNLLSKLRQKDRDFEKRVKKRR